MASQVQLAGPEPAAPLPDPWAGPPSEVQAQVHAGPKRATDSMKHRAEVSVTEVLQQLPQELRPRVDEIRRALNALTPWGKIYLKECMDKAMGIRVKWHCHFCKTAGLDPLEHTSVDDNDRLREASAR